MGILSPELDAAIGTAAANIGVSPEAIKQVIAVESNGDPRASTGKYNGLTQIGPDTFNEAGGSLGGLTYDQYLKATPEQQVAAYEGYLKHYGFSDQMAKHGIDVSKMSPDQQFAVLQGMQFSPNGQDWKAAAGRGDFTIPTTNTKQAGLLGNTSIGAMAASRYGQGALGGAPAPTQVAALPQPAQPLPSSPIEPQKPLAPQPSNLAGGMPAYPWSPDQQQQPQMQPLQLNPLPVRPDMQKIARLRQALAQAFQR